MKRIIIIVILVIVAAGAWYGYNEYNRTNKDLNNIEADVTTNALALIQEFEKDSAAANKKYIDKVIEVSGTVKKIEAEENPAIIFLGDGAQMSSVQCSMDSTYSKDYASLKEGASITIKGMCTGARFDDLFGTDVILNRAVIQSEK